MAGPVTTDVTIRWGAWYQDADLPLAFPAGWRVLSCPPRDAPDIGPAGIADAFAHPIGTAPLEELARGRGSACVAIDDLSRPTPGARLLPPVLDALGAAGIAGDDVHVLAGVANHRPMVRADLRKKLGDEVLARCRVSNHFSWDHCVPVGATASGSPVEINADFLAAGVRILVGSIIPHGATGFSGGAKLLFPGIASIASAKAFHTGTALRGRYGQAVTDARLEAEEAARLVGVDAIVNAIPNSSLGLAGVVVGDVVAAHRAGVEIARRVFASPAPADCDVCVLSLYPKDAEWLQHVTAFSPWLTARRPIVREGGTVVVAAAATEGLGSHSLFGPGMQLAAARATRVRGRDLVFFSPGMDHGALPAAMEDGTVLFNTWDRTIDWLGRKHGPTATVAVYPCATMQLAGDDGEVS